MNATEIELCKHEKIQEWIYNTYVDCENCLECDGHLKEECINSFKDTVPALEQLFGMLKGKRLLIGIADNYCNIMDSDIEPAIFYEGATLLEALLRAVIGKE